MTEIPNGSSLDQAGVDRRTYEKPVCGSRQVHGQHFYSPIDGMLLNCPGAFRPLYKIAEDIRDHWEKPFLAGPEHPARPYILAMCHLTMMSDKYGHDDAEDIVIRFLGNATGWRGEDAKRVKAELKSMLPKRRAR